MNKYIDADKLKAEIERRIESWTICGKNSPLGQGKDTCESRVTELSDMLSFITSLQQEQPESGSSEKPNNHIRGYDEAYLNEGIAKASKTWEGVDTDKYLDEARGREQERPEVDLEKEINRYCGTRDIRPVPDFMDAVARHFFELGLTFMARMFYQYPNVAKEWYEQLSKATMD